MVDLSLEALTGGKEAVLKALAADPEFKATRFKALGNTMDAAARVAHALTTTKAAQLVDPVLRVRLAQFIASNGQRPQTAGLEADEWDSAVDDEIANVLEPYSKALSASWLGQYTVDTRMHLPGELDRLVASFAKEIWKQLTYQKETTAKTLSAVGIVEDDIANFLSSLTPQAQQPTLELIPDMSMNRVLNKIMLSSSTTGEMADELALVIDDATDGFIVQQVAERLGIDLEDVEVLRLAALNGYNAGELAAFVTTGDMLDEGDSAMPGEPALQPDDPATAAIMTASELDDEAARLPPAVAESPLPAPATGRKKRAPAGPVAGAIPKEVLEAVRDTGSKDDEMGDLLGFSRSTYNNYVKGKAAFVPSDAQKDALTNYIRTRANKLITILSTLTGEPHDEV